MLWFTIAITSPTTSIDISNFALYAGPVEGADIHCDYTYTSDSPPALITSMYLLLLLVPAALCLIIVSLCPYLPPLQTQAPLFSPRSSSISIIYIIL